MTGKEEKDGRKERNKEENARTKVRNRERFLTFRNAYTIREIIIIYCCVLYEETEGSLSPVAFPQQSPSPCPVLIPSFLSGGFSAIGRTEDTIT